MKESNLILTELRQNAPEMPPVDLIRQVVTAWLTKELYK